ncbi:uncharacterized protein LOC123317645 [Coccinella septempunctata]|uniref:uncharacterized protein LOC123317645 n=1 Tax=Coccinella septempunctata TaxID=41139 RepID=UPI001D0670F1|nr:uncharacterized protein LOC123317645 [Coccinella septempunctata]
MQVGTKKEGKHERGQENDKSKKLKSECMWKIATWNVRGIQGKEDELEAEFEDIGLELLAITETKKKGEGSTRTKNDHLLIYSGVEKNRRAQSGVGCLISRRICESVYGWRNWSDRILSVEIKHLNNEIKTIIVVYGPNEDDNTETKDKFWEDLTMVTEEAKGIIIILGDFNGRVGRMDRMYKEVMGPFGKNIRNNNVIETAKEACGSYKKSNKKKQTAWWTKEVKAQLKMKKEEKWRKYLSNRTTDNYEQYENQRKSVKALILSLKKKKWKEFGEKMETSYKTNQKLFYRTLKAQRNEELLDGGQDEREESYGKPENVDDYEGGRITMEELKQAIKTLKNGKAPGCDKITSEIIKNLGNNGLENLLRISERVWKEEIIPEDWQTALIVPIYKKGDKQNCNNYRGITLLSTVIKLYEIILDKKIREKVETTLEETQSGFRRGRSIQDVFTMKILCEKARTENRNLYVGFIDLVKAFDKVKREKLWTILERRGVNEKLLKVVKNIYKLNKNQVISLNRTSETFHTKAGLRHGGSLSPVLFLIFMDEILKEVTKRTKKYQVGYKNLQRVEISECAFVDDIIVINGREKDLQRNMEIWNEITRDFGMEINTTKTKVMVIGNPEEIKIQLDGTKIEQVKTFRYLGVELSGDGKQDIEINGRIESTIKLFHMMNTSFISKREISQNTKIKVYKAVYRPTLTFACESWALNRKQKNLEIEPLQDFIDKRQLSWWGHLNRMNNARPVKQIWEAKIQKRKKRGRPEQTWNNTITEIINGKGQTWNEARTMAMDKRLWTQFVHGREFQ